MSTPVEVEVRRVVGAVLDPELPMITIEDLGILREVRVVNSAVQVSITPTYSGCPAMEAIRDDIAAALASAGYEDVEVRTVLAPAWTTDWISERGRATMLRHGIAPPGPRHDGPVPLTLSVRCPRCGSANTGEISRFGSTSCKSLWVCRECREPFDRFKEL